MSTGGGWELPEWSPCTLCHVDLPDVHKVDAGSLGGRVRPWSGPRHDGAI